jgi:hypothetical protein
MTRTPKDLCKGCRECWNGILRAIVSNPYIAGLCMGIPTYFLSFALIFQDSMVVFLPEYYYIKTSATGPFFTLYGFTILSWIIECIGIKLVLPNLLSTCAFFHSAIGSWWFINLFIVLFAGWAYIPMRMMFVVLIGVLTPSIIWHLTGDIIREYKRKLINEITLNSQSMANQDAIFRPDMEMGLDTGKPKTSFSNLT